MNRLLALATTCLSAAAIPASASAELAGSGLSPAAPLGGERTAGIVLPPISASAASTKQTANWNLIAPHASTQALNRLAITYGGRVNARIGVLTVPRSHAREAARRLGGALRSAGPDVIGRRHASFEQAGGAISSWSRSIGAPPTLTPGPGTLAPIGVVDDAVDTTVAELSSAIVVNGVSPKGETHGTMVASTAAAPYNGTGVVGVAPGAQVYSWGVTSLSCADVSLGITTLADRGAKVINVSLGFNQLCGALERAVVYAYARGVTVVSSPGNEGDQDNPLEYPSSYQHVISAAAMKPNFTIASFSNYDDFVDVAAPGVDVPVDVPVRADDEDDARDGVTTVSGTSFSSPYVAGGISWILGARPDLDPGQVAAILRASNRDIEQPGWDPYSGYGLIQISAALGVPTPPKDPLEPNDQPEFTRAASKGIFGKPYLWDGGAKATIQAFGDSADDDLDAYRIRVPARSDVKVQLRPIRGSVNLYAFRSSATDFYRSTPVAASRRGGLKMDTIWIRNSSNRSRAGFVVVNSVSGPNSRRLSEYTLSVRRG